MFSLFCTTGESCNVLVHLTHLSPDAFTLLGMRAASQCRNVRPWIHLDMTSLNGAEECIHYQGHQHPNHEMPALKPQPEEALQALMHHFKP